MVSTKKLLPILLVLSLISSAFAYTIVVNIPSSVNVIESQGLDKMLTFDVLYNDHSYNVSLWVPLSTYNEAVQKIGSVVYSWFPNIERPILEQAYYLWRHTESPTNYPILKISVLENDQPKTEKELKTRLVDGLLKYSFELFYYAWPDKLSEYQSNGEQWLKAHNDLTWTVRVSDAVTTILDYATIVGALSDDAIDLLGGTTQSEQLKSGVTFFVDLIYGKAHLVETYGADKADAIVNILFNLGFISSSDYNGAEVYEKFQEDPAGAVDAIEKINQEVFHSGIDPIVKSFLENLIGELEETTFQAFAVGTAVGLHAYFISGLTASTATQIGLSAATDSFVSSFSGVALLLKFADIIHSGYNLPMAQSLHDAWEQMKYEADLFSSMRSYGLAMANPRDNAFNLADAQVFASFSGARYLTEFYYYMHSYAHTSGQYLSFLLGGNRQQEMDILRSNAEFALSQAIEWQNLLEKLYGYAAAIVDNRDPEGTTFNSTFAPPVIVFPITPENSSGFVLITNSTSGINMTCGE